MSRHLRQAANSALLMAIVSLTATALAEAASWELQSISVKVIVAIDPGLPLAPDAAADLPKQVAAPLAAALGAAGSVHSQSAPPELRTAMLADLGALTTADVPPQTMTGFKLMFVSVGRDRGGLRVAARDLDLTTGLWNTTIAYDNVRWEQLGSVAARSVLAAFAPLARIEAAEGTTATLKLLGGALLPTSRGLPGGSGTVFRPLLMKSATRGVFEAGSARAIPWTYLTATSGSGGEVSCRIDTGLAAGSIPAYHPQQPRLALAIAPPVGSTRLKLVTAGASAAPLEGLEVLAQPAGRPGGDTWERVGTSDARGNVQVSSGASVVQILMIRQGERPLAHVPVVAGLFPEATLALADESQRVELEQSLTEIYDELVDLAARREALVARAKLAQSAKETAAFDKLKGRLGELPDTSAITARLEQAAAAVKSADPASQAALQPQVDALQKVLDALAAQKPLEQLEDPKPAETKSDDSKAGDAKN